MVSGITFLMTLTQRTSISSSTATAATVTTLPTHTIPISGYIGGTPLLLGVVELLVEGDRLAFVEGLEAIAINGREVNEDILATVLGGDEAEALITEEFDRSVVRHFVLYCVE